MGLMDELRKLTQPYGDDDDFYDGADDSFQPEYSQEQVDASLQFEDTFGDEVYEEPEPAPAKKPKQPAGSIFGNFGSAQQQPSRPNQKPAKSGRKNSGFGAETQVVLFNPKNFDDAGEVVSYLNQGQSLVMALEGLPTDTARRLLDFISGIAFALNAKITPVSAKTYFVTPENVDLLDAQSRQPDFDDDSDF
jgi:Uncharacterized protein conserved in bacteria